MFLFTLIGEHLL